MANGLLGLVKDQLTDKMIGKAGSLLGLPTGDARSAVTSALPAILSGIGSKVGTLDGAKSLLSLIKGQNLGASTLSNMIDSKGGDVADMGSKLASSVFGSSQDSVLDKVASLSGIGRDKSSKLMGFLTPAVMGTLGKAVSDKNLDAGGLKNLFGDYTANLGAATGSVKNTAAKATSNVKETASTARATATGDSGGGGGMGWLKWLLPLLLLGALAYWFMGRSGDTTKSGSMDKTEMKSVDRKVQTQKGHEGHDHTGHEGHNHAPGEGHGKTVKDAATGAATTVATGATGAAGAVAGAAGAAMADAKDKVASIAGLTVDAAGNLVRDGKIIAKKGAFKEVDGNYVDANGKKLGIIQKVGKAIGDAGKAVGGAIAGGADAIKEKFSNAFTKKQGFTFNLSNIKWEEGGHKITSFSKDEVMGIAAALKANKDGKIEVQVNGDDKALSKKRAQVIHDQLVTLGVPSGQISAKGMGDGDASTGTKVKIAVK